MAAASFYHTVLLRSDGRAVACGGNQARQCSIPALVGNVTYTQVAAGHPYANSLRIGGQDVHTIYIPGSSKDVHTVLLRSDGQAVAFGGEFGRLFNIPALVGGLTYTQIAAGHMLTVLCRSDGTAVAYGANESGQCNIPALVGSLTYTQVAAGGHSTVLLRSDGMAVACGLNDKGQCDIPALVGDLTYSQVATGGQHTVLLRSDGMAVACGLNDKGQCDMPALVGDLTYTQLAAGTNHTLLLRSDGTAVAFGQNGQSQCDIPALVDDLAYTQVAAGSLHSVLLRGDGTAVACGQNGNGQCSIPSLKSWTEFLSFKESLVRYVPDRVPIMTKVVVLQVSFSRHAAGDMMHFWKLSGDEQCSFRVLATDQMSDILEHLKHELGHYRVDAVLSGGRLLSQVVSQDPLTTLEPFM